MTAPQAVSQQNPSKVAFGKVLAIQIVAYVVLVALALVPGIAYGDSANPAVVPFTIIGSLAMIALLVVFSPFRDGTAGHVIAVIAGLLSVVCATTMTLGRAIFAADATGGKDFSMEDEAVEITTDPADFSAVREYLEGKGYAFATAEVQMVPDTSRETANEMMRLNGYLDVLIPRGGAGLINSVVQNSTVPVIQTGVGNCHIFVDETADLKQATDIVFNAKTSRPSVCNAAETLLVHEAIAQQALPQIAARLAEKNVELRGCPRTCEILSQAVPAVESDWKDEFLDYILAVRVVRDLDEALAHIARYSTGHSEAIVTRDYENAMRFTREVDSAAVYVNASTRFTDGGELGLGAEIGISTQKLHARGPMGVLTLTSTKHVILGNGQIR